MRKQLNLSCYLIIGLLAIFLNLPLLATPGDCPGGTVLWHNLSDNGLGASTNPGISTDVYNQNIDIRGRNALVDGVRVVASTCDILITVTNEDSIITGSGNRADGVPTGSARLYLFADTGHSITFSITQDLMFRGTATHNGASLLDLLVSFSGPGAVDFVILGDKTVTFTSLVTTGGTRAYVAMSSSPAPELTFNRMDGALADQTHNVEVGVGPRSLLGFISENSVSVNGGGSDEGVVLFDTTNSGTGRLILRVANQGQVLISGRLLDANPGIDGEFTIGDIQLTTPAGQEADFQVANDSSATAGGLLIINHNSVLPNLVIDPFCDGAFTVTGTQAGFILGSNGVVIVDDNTYIDYVGTTTNQCPNPAITLPEELVEQGYTVQSVIKARNPSAFIVDDSTDPNAITPAILLSPSTSGGSAAVYFRSGVDENGRVQELVDGAISFTIDPTQITEGEGNLVFDVEGDLDVIGNDAGHQALHILSLHVTPSGGPVLVRSGETIFPLRSFAQDANGDFLRYNSAYMMVNRRLNLNTVSMVHDDENHQVFEKNDSKSEPTYVGGERFKLIEQGICSGNSSCNGLRPKITLSNAYFRFNTSAALTGVDVLTTNSITGDNESKFIFYSNGRIVDSGNGRQLILGTDPGSFACDGGTIIDRNAQFDIIQELADASPGEHLLTLSTEPNDNTVNSLITTPFATLETQPSIHTIYLGHASNISIGTQDTVGTTSDCSTTFALTTTPHLLVDGCYFSFATRGGTLCYPEVSNVTGEGGIFVDTNGLFDVANARRLNISTMVTKSRNGRVVLPKSQVFFSPRIGISDWQLNLTDASQRTIIPAGALLSDYTLDWISTTKDYTSSSSLVPYEFCEVSECSCPTVLEENLRALPEIHGTVDQLQIKRSRLGDMAQIKVGSSAYVKELVFLSGFDSAEAPVGLIVIQDDARIGLGSAHRNVDSLQSSIVLGVNGVTLVPNGNGKVQVNEDLIVNNVCHIVSGTAFGATEQNILSFSSETEKELRVKTGSTLDLSSFTSTNQVIEFTGNIRLVMETGSKLVLGGGILQFSGTSQLVVQRSLDDFSVTGTTVTATDANRLIVIGTGEIRMREASSATVYQEAAVGIETLATCSINTTNILWRLNDASHFTIGSSEAPGGVLQVGNTTNQASSSITFSLVLDGLAAQFDIDRAGFLGLGAGIIQKDFDSAPNSWTIGSLFNVTNITIDMPQGIFTHNDIFDGSQPEASLMALGGNSDATFSFVFSKLNSEIRGGANLVKIAPTVVSLLPTVTSFTGTVSSDLKVGLFSSQAQLTDPRVGAQPVGVLADTLFDYLKARNVRVASNAYASPRAAFAQNALGYETAGYIFNTTIFRSIAPRLLGEGGFYTDPRESLEQGAVGITVNSDGSIATLTAYVK